MIGSPYGLARLSLGWAGRPRGTAQADGNRRGQNFSTQMAKNRVNRGHLFPRSSVIASSLKHRGRCTLGQFPKRASARLPTASLARDGSVGEAERAAKVL
jgi:hypothetical protein